MSRRVRFRVRKAIFWALALVLAIGAGSTIAAYNYVTRGDTLVELIRRKAPHYLPRSKVDLIQAGAFEDVDAAMMIHPAPFDVLDPRCIAVAHVDVHFHGKAAHASAFPDQGINALDAAVQAYVNISTLRQHLLPTDKIHGIIAEGGEAPNVIPAYTRSSWYVRYRQ